jgi:flavin-binding protein dodecin
MATRGAEEMPDSVYRVTEVIGVSSDSWEAAARHAVETAAKSVRDLRVAEVVRQDVTIENGTVANYASAWDSPSSTRRATKAIWGASHDPVIGG